MQVWQQAFDPTYTRADGLLVLNDASIPLPDGFAPDAQFRSNVVFPPGSRGGDHYHTAREEVFVGFGEGMELIVEDPATKERHILAMDMSKHEGKCVAFYIPAGLPHAIMNRGSSPGYVIEFATLAQEKVDYPL